MKRSHRHVRLILNEDAPGIGFAGELVNLRAGFARNFLLPKNLATVATPKLIKENEKKIAEAVTRRQKATEDLKKLAEKLSSEPVKLKLKTGPDGQVFGSITVAMVARALKDSGNEIDPKNLSGLPVKTLGRVNVSAKLGLGVMAQIPLEITGEKAKAPKKESTTA